MTDQASPTDDHKKHMKSADPKRLINPGFGRRNALPHPKGRELSDLALSEIDALYGQESLQNDRLIEYLHKIQDHHGHLSTPNLAALAHRLKLSMVEVYEVASFYAHFDIVMDGEQAPPALTVRVCDSLTCCLFGADELLANLSKAASDDVRFVRAPCIGRCAAAPAALVGRNALENATVESIQNAISNQQTQPVIPDYPSLADYRNRGGYQHLLNFRDGTITADDIITKLEASGLRGLGGAGFPSSMKWKFVRSQPGPRLMAVNGDEGEPGTFKDRHYLEAEPHRFLEGTLIGAHAVEADRVYIYLRDEYPHLHDVLNREIAALEASGLITKGYLEMRRGAGAYICGEETAMLESIEGKRGYPRQKPPFPTQVGLFGRPTLIHNVETLYWIPLILDHPPEWLHSHGRNGRKGLRSFSVSGRVRNPGVKLAPAGISVRELIDEFCGGMAEGHTFKGYLPGGASGGILPATMDNIPLDFGTLEQHGCFIGSAAVVVLSDHDKMRMVVQNLMRFFEDESCGQCTPCRVGTEKAIALLNQPEWDKPLLEDLAKVMRDASICGLGQAATNPLLSVLKHFPEDLR
jgi:formate dehydrogenase